MRSWYEVLYTLSPNLHLQMGTLLYLRVPLGICGYFEVLLGTYRLRVAMNHMVVLHSSSRPTFPCSSPSQLRETNELPFFVSSLLQTSSNFTFSQHCAEIFYLFWCHQGNIGYITVNILCTAGITKFPIHTLPPGTRECIKKYLP